MLLNHLFQTMGKRKISPSINDQTIMASTPSAIPASATEPPSKILPFLAALGLAKVFSVIPSAQWTQQQLDMQDSITSQLKQTIGTLQVPPAFFHQNVMNSHLSDSLASATEPSTETRPLSLEPDPSNVVNVVAPTSKKTLRPKKPKKVQHYQIAASTSKNTSRPRKPKKAKPPPLHQTKGELSPLPAVSHQNEICPSLSSTPGSGTEPSMKIETLSPGADPSNAVNVAVSTSKKTSRPIKKKNIVLSPPRQKSKKVRTVLPVHGISHEVNVGASNSQEIPQQIALREVQTPPAHQMTSAEKRSPCSCLEEKDEYRANLIWRIDSLQANTFHRSPTFWAKEDTSGKMHLNLYSKIEKTQRNPINEDIIVLNFIIEEPMHYAKACVEINYCFGTGEEPDKQTKCLSFNSAGYIEEEGCEHGVFLNNCSHDALTLTCNVALIPHSRQCSILMEDQKITNEENEPQPEVIFKKELFSEFVNLKCEDQTLVVHRGIMEFYSSVLSAKLKIKMEEVNSKEIILSDIKYDVLLQLVTYMYTRIVPDDNTGELMIASLKYDIRCLSLKLQEKFAAYIASDNYLDMLKWSKRYKLELLKESVVSFIKKTSLNQL